MSLKYTALVTQLENANKVIKDLTPLEGGVQDAGALEDWVRMQNGKVDMVTAELKRLQSKLACEFKCAPWKPDLTGSTRIPYRGITRYSSLRRLFSNRARH
jgi:hypothetical protein